MSKTYTIADGKNRFPEMVREAERPGVVEVTRRGRPVARLISEQEYQRVIARRPSLWEAVKRIRSSPDVVPIDELNRLIERHGSDRVVRTLVRVLATSRVDATRPTRTWCVVAV